MALLLSSSNYADALNKKEVYSFQSKDGTTVFTDKRPAKASQYKTQTIESITPSTNNTNSHTVTHYNDSTQINHTQTIVYENQNSIKKKKPSSKKHGKGKHSLSRCQRYKEKLDDYSEKMRSGYTNSEYKKLEKNRKKYKNLLFKHCDTKTFSE